MNTQKELKCTNTDTRLFTDIFGRHTQERKQNKPGHKNRHMHALSHKHKHTSSISLFSTHYSLYSFSLNHNICHSFLVKATYLSHKLDRQRGRKENSAGGKQRGNAVDSLRGEKEKEEKRRKERLQGEGED